MEVSPEANGGERLNVELIRQVRHLGCREPADECAELIFPMLGDDILHHRSMVTEVVGDLNSAGKLDLLVTTVG